VLENIRRKKDHWVSALLVLIVAAVMAFFGVSKFSEPVGPNQPVAWVNGEVVTQKEFARELEFTVNQYRSVLGNKFDEKLLEAFQVPQRTLERIIQFKLICQQAEKMGFFISDDELADHIKSLPFFQKDGKFNAALYSQLPNRGLEEKKQREEMSARRLQKYMTSRVKNSPGYAQMLQNLKNTQVSLDYAIINFNDLAKSVKPTETEIQQVLNDQALLTKEYELKKKDFMTPAKYQFRQIRVGVPFQSTPEQKETSRKKILEISKSLRADNFENTAQKESDDEFAKLGGKRSWTSEKDLPPMFSSVLNQLSPQGISEVFEAPGGFFVVQLLEKQDSQTSPLDSVKKELAREIAEQKVKSTFIDNIKKSWEAKLAQGQTIDAELKQKDIKIKKTPNFSLDKNTIPEIGNSEAILEAIFELSPSSKVVKRLYLFQDQYYYLKLASLSKTEPKTKTGSEEQIPEEKTAYQNVIFEDWLKGIEKQASIKMKTSSDEKKTQSL